jgi:hypothetical protein
MNAIPNDPLNRTSCNCLLPISDIVTIPVTTERVNAVCQRYCINSSCFLSDFVLCPERCSVFVISFVSYEVNPVWFPCVFCPVASAVWTKLASFVEHSRLSLNSVSALPLKTKQILLSWWLTPGFGKFGVSARGSVVAWGITLKAWRSRVLFPTRALDFLNDLIVQAALWPCDRLSF